MSDEIGYAVARSVRGTSRPAPLLGIQPEPWMDGALCAQVDTDLFFPEKGATARPAKQVCAACDVRDECLAYALEHQERFGIWGGLSERERRRLTKRSAA